MYENEDHFIPLIWEGDGGHPSPDYSTRKTNYAILALPSSAFNGDTFDVGGGNVYSRYHAIYTDLVDVPSPMELDVIKGITGEQIEIIADALMTETIAVDDYRIIFILTYFYSDTYNSTVVRYYEEDFNLTTSGSTGQFAHIFDLDPNWDLDLVNAVAIVQHINTTGDFTTSGYTFHMYPILQAGLAVHPLIAPNPIANIEMDLNEIVTFDLTDYFHFLGNPVAAEISVQSCDPTIVEAVLNGTDLTLTSFDNSGNSQIDIVGFYDGYNCISTFDAHVIDPNVNYIVILDFAPSLTGSTLKTSIESFYTNGNVYLTDDVNTYPLSDNTDAVFVLLGVYNTNFVLTETEAVPLAAYLDEGGNVYMEGGDTWFYNSATSVHSYFRINGIAVGTADLLNVIGTEFLSGMSWTYNGQNNYIDHLSPMYNASVIFSNPDPEYNCGIAYDSGNYKTVGTSFEITGLGGANSFDEAVYGILDFFELEITNSPNEDLPAVHYSLSNYPNPFNPSTTISFSVQQTSSFVILGIYNLKGQKVKILVNEILPIGKHSVIWNGKDEDNNPVSSGIYLYKIRAGDFEKTRKMILLK
jgi:hypothetical protein